MAVSTQDSSFARLAWGMGSRPLSGFSFGSLPRLPIMLSRNSWKKNTTNAASTTEITVDMVAPSRPTFVPWATRFRPRMG